MSVPTSHRQRRSGRDRPDQHGARATQLAARSTSRRSRERRPHVVDASCETGYPTDAAAVQLPSTTAQLPVRLRRRPGLQRPDPVADQLDLRRAEAAARAARARASTPAVFELSAYQQSDIDTWAHHVLRPGLHAAAARHHRRRRPAEPRSARPATPARRTSTATPATSRSTPTSRRSSRSRRTRRHPSSTTRRTTTPARPSSMSTRRSPTTTRPTSVSSSWGVCENDVSAGYVQAENTIFEQMALQGQSMFGAAGDTGAFDCIRSDGTTIVNVADPPSQPWVTSVGGTSFENFNPGTNPNPSYPAKGIETVWNVDNLCNTSADEGGDSTGGFFWCAATGAGGGGTSQFWGRPFYQHGPGRQQPVHHVRQRHDAMLAGREGHAVPRGAGHLGQRRRVHAVRRVLHRQRDHPVQRVRHLQRQPAGPRAGSASAARACRRRCGRRSSPTATASRATASATSTRCCTCCSPSPRDRTSTTSPASGHERQQQRPVPDHAGYDVATGIGTPKMAALITGGFGYGQNRQ